MAGRTYRYATREPQFPFGFGLSYTRFAYRTITALGKIQAGAALPVQVEVANVGPTDAEEVVQLYLSPAAPAPGDPLYTLVDFRRVALAAGETQTVDFTLSPAQLASVDEEGRSAIRPGAYRLIAGGSSPGARSLALGAPAPVAVEFVIG